MPIQKFVDVRVGDVVRLRRTHPCGGTDWTVVRLGADIGLTCERCHHRVLLPRSQFERRLKEFVSRVPRGVDLSTGAQAATEMDEPGPAVTSDEHGPTPYG
jgi:hypothetical protein